MPQNPEHSAIFDEFEEQFAHQWPVSSWREHTIVIAVSGGADSVALLRVVHRLWSRSAGKGGIIVGHINHQTRGKQSDEDEKWVANLAAQLNLPFAGKKMLGMSPSSNFGEGLESILRQHRFKHLLQIANQHGARFIALGHNRDDQIETVLFRILRGTGLSGLAGIPRSRILDHGVTLVRPLLEFARDAILQYLSRKGQTFLNDCTNTEESFTRNRIRHKLLPELRQGFNVNLDQAILRLAGLAEESHRFCEDEANKLLNKVASFGPSSVVTLELGQHKESSPYLIRTMLRLLWEKMNWPQQDMSFQKGCWRVK